MALLMACAWIRRGLQLGVDVVVAVYNSLMLQLPHKIPVTLLSSITPFHILLVFGHQNSFNQNFV